jgi:hypothetical protein
MNPVWGLKGERLAADLQMDRALLVDLGLADIGHGPSPAQGEACQDCGNLATTPPDREPTSRGPFRRRRHPR